MSMSMTLMAHEARTIDTALPPDIWDFTSADGQTA